MIRSQAAGVRALRFVSELLTPLKREGWTLRGREAAVWEEIVAGAGRMTVNIYTLVNYISVNIYQSKNRPANQSSFAWTTIMNYKIFCFLLSVLETGNYFLPVAIQNVHQFCKHCLLIKIFFALEGFAIINRRGRGLAWSLPLAKCPCDKTSRRPPADGKPGGHFLSSGLSNHGRHE